MKKLLRVLIPLILVVVLLGFTVWYFAVYDREFTKDLLLDGARTCERTGYHKIASWLYDLAYYQSGAEDEIAIELADQYISSGNYTKAEYTLSKAIANNPTAKLYAQLCRLYVRQDKLIDAVAILDTVSDPAIKAQLELQRPPVPTVTPEEDFYSQYIDVMVLGEGGTVYATSDGTYPSIAGGSCTQPISLELGETVIYTLCVSDDELVSSLGVYGYTVGGIIEAVEFADPSFESEVRQLLGLAEDTVIYTNDLWAITDFAVPMDATTYSDLTYFPYLQTLIIENGIEQELNYISSLTELSQLHLYNCDPSSELLTVIAAMPYLKELSLRGCGLTSIAELKGALDLTYLDLSENTLRNITPLSGMTKLEELYLSGNALTDLSALSGLSELKILDVSYNSLSTAEPICSLKNLQQLYISHNKLYSLGNIQNLTGLTHFSATHNNLTDVRGLANCTKLQELDISNNSIADITMLASLTDLTRLYFAHNTVTALPAFAPDTPLITIDGSHNLIISVAELAQLPHLNNVLLDYNPDLEDVTALDTCPLLILLNVYGTKVTEVEFLLDKSVIVNYNPVLDIEEP